MESVVAALVTGALTLAGVIVSNSRTRVVMEVKIGNLTRQVERHSRMVERTYALKQYVAVVRAEIESMWKGPSCDLVDSIAQRPHERLSPITAGACEDKELYVLLARIRALDVTVVNLLLMSLFEEYRDDTLSHEDFSSILRTVESYLFRRAACDVATNSLNKFFSSVIARLATVREDGGDIREAFEAILLGEEGTARRMPSDAEFERALRTRDCYAFKRGFYLLTTLENSYHTKDPLDFSGGTFTIEHVMPQNALASAEWRETLGPDCERIHEELVNTLGNLTLTAYNPELSDASFTEKKAHLKGGYEKDYLVISKELHVAGMQGENPILDRDRWLLTRALKVRLLSGGVCLSCEGALSSLSCGHVNEGIREWAACFHRHADYLAAGDGAFLSHSRPG